MDINPLATLDKVQPKDIDSGPVVILNLLKFKPGESLTTYLEYVSRVMNDCGDSGIEVIYGGELKEQIQGDIGDWDAVIVVRYPSLVGTRTKCFAPTPTRQSIRSPKRL